MDLASIINDNLSNVQGSHHPPHDVPLLADYVRYATEYRNLAPETVKKQMWYLLYFFEWVKRSLFENQPRPLCPDTVQQFAFEYKADHGPGSRKNMYFSLRSFLEFAYHKGYLDQNITRAVPSPRRRRLSTVPFIIDDASIIRLLASIDRSEPSGIRDYTIIQLLASYGVRGIQIRKLTLQDIDWEKNSISFSAAKGGNPVVQHLTAPVGNSLLDYIMTTRPKKPSWSEVFLTLCKPIHPLGSPALLSSIVVRRLGKAGIKLPDEASNGSHLFRHAFATRMLKHGRQFTEIADMLGHKYLDSTFLYTKVDFQMLKQTTLEWPGGEE
jgi:integrase